MNNLELNKVYLVNTKLETLKNKKLKVISIRNWAEAITLHSDMHILNLAINEKFIEGDVNVLSLKELMMNSNLDSEDKLAAFKNKTYYCCIDIESGEGIQALQKALSDDYNINDYKVYIIWDNIINFDKTNIISATYKYDLTLDIKDNVDVPVSKIIEDLHKHVKGTYGESVKMGINFIYTDQTKKEDLLKIREEELEKAKYILDRLNNLTMIEPLLNQLIDSKLGENVNSLIEDVSEVKSIVESISKLIG